MLLNRRTAMEKFEELILKLAEAEPNTPLTPAAKSVIQDRLKQWVVQYKTPDHPPYSAMIERALRELNEKRGSNEKSISQFLEKEYKDLPWAHSTLLKHHLGKLCESGDIVLTRGQKYMFGGADPTSVQSSCKRKPPSKRKVRWDWEREKNKRRKRKRNQLKGEIVEFTENHLESDVQEKLMLKAGDEEDQAKWSKGMQADDDNPSELPTTPEMPPGFESFTVEEFLDLPFRPKMLDPPLNMWNLASYPVDCVKQSEEVDVQQTSSYEHERQQQESLESDQIQSLDNMKSKKNKKAAVKGKDTLISEGVLLTMVDEPQQREHYPLMIEAHDEMLLQSKKNTSRRSSSRIRNKFPEQLNEKEKHELVAVGEESLSKSKREQRQLRRWSSSSPPVEMTLKESKSLTSVSNSLQLVLSSDQQHGQEDSTPITNHQRQWQQPPKENRVFKAEEDVLPRVKRYGRRRKDNKFQ